MSQCTGQRLGKTCNGVVVRCTNCNSVGCTWSGCTRYISGGAYCVICQKSGTIKTL
jgi:hypothetical protein